jgi:hypothetical protein
MKSVNRYISALVALFLLLMVMFIFLAYYNQVIVMNIIAVLIGSSLTAILTFFLESFKQNSENEKLISAIRSEINYNLANLKKNLVELEKEKEEFEDTKALTHPLLPLRTSLWDLIKDKINETSLGGNYYKLIKTISYVDYINYHLKIRDDYIADMTLKESKELTIISDMDLDLIDNIKETIDNLKKLSDISFK